MSEFSNTSSKVIGWADAVPTSSSSTTNDYQESFTIQTDTDNEQVQNEPDPLYQTEPDTTNYEELPNKLDESETCDAVGVAAEENQNLVQSSNEIINTSSTSISADAFEPDYTGEVFEEDKDYYTDQIVDALLNLPMPKAEVIEKVSPVNSCRMAPDYIKIDISPFQLKALITMVLQAEKKEDLDYFRIAQAALQVQQSWWPLMENTNGYTFESSDCFEEFLDFINDRTDCSDYSDYVE